MDVLFIRWGGGLVSMYNCEFIMEFIMESRDESIIQMDC